MNLLQALTRDNAARQQVTPHILITVVVCDNQIVVTDFATDGPLPVIVKRWNVAAAVPTLAATVAYIEGELTRWLDGFRLDPNGYTSYHDQYGYADSPITSTIVQ